MNDLAEKKALHGAQATARHLARRPSAPLAIIGFVGATAAVVAGGKIGAADNAVPISRWLGLLAPPSYQLVNAIPATVMLAGIVVLSGAWMLLVELCRRARISERTLWLITAAWAVPFVIGPPQLSTDVYSSTAHGLLIRIGLDPYRYAPDALNKPHVINAIDPSWRGSVSTGGPLTTFLEHLASAITGGHPVATVIALRVFATCTAVVIGWLAGRLAGPHRIPAIALTAANPAVLLYIVSAGHLDGAMIALVLGALVCVNAHRWTLAVVLACLAAGVKPIAIVVLAMLIAVHAIGQRRHFAWRIAARDALVAVATLTASTLVVSDGVGWLRNVDVITHEHTPFAPASIVSDLMSAVIPGASYDDLAVGGRIAALLAAVTAISYLLVTVLDRPLERTVGFAFLAIGLLAPVLYPWYLLWGVCCLAPSATRARRDWVVALSALACVLTPAGFGDRTAESVTIGAAALLGGGLLARTWLRNRELTAAG
jgi:hypothetical protein